MNYALRCDACQVLLTISNGKTNYMPPRCWHCQHPGKMAWVRLGGPAKVDALVQEQMRAWRASQS